MLRQKEMIARNYDELTSTEDNGKKVAATFVPGNLNELIMTFGMLNNLPNIPGLLATVQSIPGLEGLPRISKFTSEFFF